MIQNQKAHTNSSQYVVKFANKEPKYLWKRFLFLVCWCVTAIHLGKLFGEKYSNVWTTGTTKMNEHCFDRLYDVVFHKCILPLH